MLDSYYAKTKHTNDERKLYSNFMERQYREYLKKYHEVKIKYRHNTKQKMSFSDFKTIYEMDYKETRDTKEVMNAFLKKENLTVFDTPDVDRYFEIKEKNFLHNLQNVKDKVALGMPLSQLDSIMLDAEEKRKRGNRSFEWLYIYIETQANALGIIWQRAYDSPEEEEG
jgi:hypothetical protein